jgi:hypothetical protein
MASHGLVGLLGLLFVRSTALKAISASSSKVKGVKLVMNNRPLGEIQRRSFQQSRAR